MIVVLIYDWHVLYVREENKINKYNSCQGCRRYCLPSQQTMRLSAQVYGLPYLMPARHICQRNYHFVVVSHPVSSS